MRSISVPVLFLSAVLMHGQANAADVTPKGAKDLKQQLLSALPDGMVKDASAMTVRARKSAYEVRVNTIALFGIEAIKFTKAVGISPVVSLIRPLDGGLWQIDQAGGIDVKGQTKEKGPKSNFLFSVDSYSMTGIYDPTITYLQSGTYKTEDMRLRLQTGDSSTDIRLGTINSTVQGAKDGDKTITVASSGTFTNLVEAIRASKADPAGFRAGSGESSVKIEGVAFQPLQKMIAILVKNWDKSPMDEAEKRILIQLFRSNFPLFKTMSQTVVYRDMQVETPQGPFTAKRFGIETMIDGISNGARFGFGLDLVEPRMVAGLVPAAYVPLIPQTATIKVAVPSVNAADGINYLMDNVDYDPAQPLTPPQKSEISRRFFPDGIATIAYDGTRLASSLYDVTVTGKTTFALTGNDKPLVDVTVTARDFDKTIAYLQTNAKQTPELGQTAFFLLMAKGFAKTQDDGQLLWHVETDRTGQIKVNGNAFSIPGAAPDPAPGTPPAP
ncbi:MULTISPECIES: hypothetical protein [Rhizobium/Agrobacterium group]|uniref:DUF2125 domain-containing protein n=2 Tax=Rhizobium/Agrobacterium group TaxID=227290 RepID=B9JZ44_ALLAM|nr:MULTISPECIES: hypothetical protein [Rhizobium/Agrobacterium group]ACM37290.1 Conserved hypothetical protein [Allorhizobium ampelinum S4]MCF1492375.1 hypothetical protein [Allorhizobium ampelinum]MUO30199.1 hypothetical protein [Agrobacterium vitis]MUO45064.1 hypothetical protein [Agrobacterium vitis]MUP11960.1 hypothetical protein [Agrobacterium vitis]